MNRAYLSLLSKFVPGLLVAFIINSFFVRNVRCFHSATKFTSFRRGSSLIPTTPRILLQCKYHERNTVFPSALVKHKGYQPLLYSTTNMDDSEEVGVTPRRSTRNRSTPQTDKEDHADAKVALDASPTKAKKKVVKRKVTALSTGSDGDESEASAASVKKKMKVVKKKVVKRKVTKSTIKTPEDASDDEASAVSIVSAKASPIKKKSPAPKKEKSPVKKKKTAKTEPQRLTEKDELTKLWNAEEAREKHGSYSKYPIKCIA